VNRESGLRPAGRGLYIEGSGNIAAGATAAAYPGATSTQERAMAEATRLRTPLDPKSSRRPGAGSALEATNSAAHSFGLSLNEGRKSGDAPREAPRRAFRERGLS
jgi:hypothetical protein